MHISQTADSLSIDGLTALCEAVHAISRLPPATIASLDLRHHYKCLVELLIPHRAYSFVFSFNKVKLNWSVSIGDIYDELRSNGSDAISLDCFTQ